MEKVRVALSSDFVLPDGKPAFPSFDLAPLDADPRIDWGYVPVRDGRIAAADMAGVDALILLAGRFDAGSFPRDDRLALVARFGVGYDNVDVRACSANDVALVITPSGVRRPVAVAIMTFVLALSGNLLVKDRLTRAGPEGWARRGGHMGIGPGRPDPRLGRDGQHRRGAVPHGGAVRNVLRGARSPCRSRRSRASSASSWSRSTTSSGGPTSSA